MNLDKYYQMKHYKLSKLINYLTVSKFVTKNVSK